MEDFRDYLEAVCQAPRLRGTCSTYVETEVANRLRLSKLEEEFDPFGNFDMGLMVQNVVLEEKLEPEKKPEPEENSELEENLALREKPLEEKKPKETVETLPVLEGICKYAAGHVLLVGRPGSGKTTALERLLVQEAEAAGEDSTTRIPVLIRLRDLRSTVLEQMQKELQAQGLRLATEKIAELLWAGRFLVLLDGVNELPSGEMRREVESFRREYQQKTPMIFTTRELNVGLDLGIEKKLEMQPLKERQMQEFTCRYLGQEQGQQLIKGLGQRLREFGETPLLLWMLCGVFRAVGEIPTNLGGVFRGFADIYNKNRFDNQKSSEYSRFLQQLAWAMMPQNDPQGLRLSIPRSEAEEIFREFRKAEQEGNALSGAIATLDELLRFHLLRPKDDQEVEFSHQLFQEYYAGEYLLSRLPKLGDLELQKCYLNYLDWTEAIALMAGLVGDRSQAVRLVSLGLEVDLMLGARLAGEVLPQFQEETVGLITNLDLPLWLKVRLWDKTKSDQAVDSLIQALKDPDRAIRVIATQSLGKISSEQVMNALITALQDGDDEVRSNTAVALGKIESELSVNALITAFKNRDENIYVLRNIAEALERNGSERAIDFLSNALYHSEEKCCISVSALSNISSDQSGDALINALQSQYEDVRSTVAEELIRISSDQVVDFLIKALQYQDHSVRSIAAEILEGIRSHEASLKMFEDIRNEVNAIDLRNATEVFSKIQSSDVYDLTKALQHPDWDIRRNAAEVLGKIGTDWAVDALSKALQDKDWDVRRSVAIALENIETDRAMGALIKVFQNQDYIFHGNAAIAIGKISSDKLISQLWQICLSSSEQATYTIFSSEQVLHAILRIQARYRLYNYEISQTPLPAIAPTPSSNTTLIIHDGKFGDIVLGNKQIDVKGNYIERKNQP